ncbi:MAG: hypothetical protein RL351_408, partial [Actinomycetota bacterium]
RPQALQFQDSYASAWAPKLKFEKGSAVFGRAFFIATPRIEAVSSTIQEDPSATKEAPCIAKTLG